MVVSRPLDWLVRRRVVFHPHAARVGSSHRVHSPRPPPRVLLVPWCEQLPGVRIGIHTSLASAACASPRRCNPAVVHTIITLAGLPPTLNTVSSPVACPHPAQSTAAVSVTVWRCGLGGLHLPA